MKKKDHSKLITLGIIVLIAVIVYFSLTNGPMPETDEEVAKCIGENSVLYVQLGCSHCEVQKEMFGENQKYLNTVDCFYNNEECSEIKGTPSWKIDGKIVTGVQEIVRLKELTGC